MKTKRRHLRYVSFISLLILLFAMSGCSKTYPIHDFEIDKEQHPGWYTYWGNDFCEYLNVSYSESSNEQVERATYMVFESASAAKSYYDYFLDDCKKTESEIYDQGSGWVVCKVPHTYDAEITSMYYLDRNVIICADVYAAYYNTLGDTKSVDNSDMKNYILDNHNEMREFVMGLFIED